MTDFLQSSLMIVTTVISLPPMTETCGFCEERLSRNVSSSSITLSPKIVYDWHKELFALSVKVMYLSSASKSSSADKRI